jgi:imidazolonepropionase
MKKIFQNISELLTLEGARNKKGRGIEERDLSIVQNAAVAVDDSGNTAWLGASTAVPPAYHSWPRENCTGQTWLPAPVECHTHLIFAGNRAKEYGLRCSGWTYQQIAEKGGGILSTVIATREASADTLYTLALERLRKFEGQGLGAVEIKSGYGLSLESEIKILQIIPKLQAETQMQLVPTFLPAHAVPPEYKGRQDEYVQTLCKEWIPEIARLQLARYFDVFVEKGYFDLKQTEQMVRSAQDANLKIKLHVDQFNAFGGAELAARFSATSADHLDSVGPNGIAALSKSETVAVLAPGASLFTGTPYAPARALCDAGVRVALTTDFNPGTCPSTNLALMATIATSQMKMSHAEAIVGMTYSAAAAVGLDHTHGSIQVGQRLHCIRVQKPSYQEWLYGFGETPSARV